MNSACSDVLECSECIQPNMMLIRQSSCNRSHPLRLSFFLHSDPNLPFLHLDLHTFSSQCIYVPLCIKLRIVLKIMKVLCIKCFLATFLSKISKNMFPTLEIYSTYAKKSIICYTYCNWFLRSRLSITDSRLVCGNLCLIN